MARLLRLLGWLLIAGAAVLAAVQIVASKITLGNVLVSALPAGVLVSLGAQLLAQAKTSRDETEKRSLFFLESCVAAYEEAHELLKDDNNDRVTWIAAGRALIHAKALASNVSEDAHQRVLELHRLKYRGFFNRLLADKQASFFYGAKDPSLSLDQAAAQSTARTERGGRTVTSTVNELSTKSLRAVWEAGSWPKDYDDPLDRGFSSDDEDQFLVLHPGLHEFLQHKKRWHSASGKLFPNKSEDAG